LQRDKLTLIKTLTTLQETKPSSVITTTTTTAAGGGGGDHSTSTKRPGFVTRN
jgi:hypothetical protein